MTVNNDTFGLERIFDRVTTPIEEFIHDQTAGGLVLMACAVLALVLANSPWAESYAHILHTPITLSIGAWSLSHSLHHWINDGLMTLFFFVVGLEIKREFLVGELADRRRAALPIAAAIGGMVVPAGIYALINAGGPGIAGWGVPMATDIALAVGVMALAGKGVPASARAFLLGLAVVDDIGAIVVIAIFYSSGVSFAWLGVAVGSLVVTLVVRRMGVHSMLVYTGLGALMWFALHEAGVHPTLAGVAMGLLAPVTPRIAEDLVDEDELVDVTSVEHARSTMQMAKGSVSTVEWLEHVLHPWTSYVIVPIFALANAGIEISTESLRHALESPITWGVFVGLMVGKPLGVMLFSKLALRAGVADPPEGTSSRQLLGAGHAAGIGFTVAIFISELAFKGHPDAEAQVADAKMAILVASLLSGVVAFFVLRQRREPTKLS